MALPTTGKYYAKPYKCSGCGKEEMHGTNHWGSIYPMCKVCRETHWVCLEPVPEGYGVPEEWKKVRLGDICEIIEGKVGG